MKKLDEAQNKKHIVEKILQEKNTKANRLQEEVYVLKERLASSVNAHSREMDTEKQKVLWDSIARLVTSRHVDHFTLSWRDLLYVVVVSCCPT